MGVLTRIGELIKAFSVPQQDVEGQEDISIDKLESIAQKSGMKPKDIEELTAEYGKQESREERFRRDQAKAVQQDDDSKTIRGKRQTDKQQNIGENQQQNIEKNPQQPTRGRDEAR